MKRLEVIDRMNYVFAKERYSPRTARRFLALFCVVYTQQLGILFSMTSNSRYNAQDEMPALWENDQRREVTRQQNVAGESGGSTSERQEGRMAERPASQAADDTKTILEILGFPATLGDAPVRRRDCFTARTREECVLDFVRKIALRTDGCWEWTGTRGRMGHGTVKFLGENVSTHRLVLEFTLGRELQPSEFACHHCDRGWCVNPAHLYVGTMQTNMRDRDLRGRTARITGADSVHAVLTQAQVDAIRAKYKPFVCTANMLAAEFGVCRTSIKNILSRKTWKA